MIVIYPFGIPCIYAYWLFLSRAGEQIIIPRHTGFFSLFHLTFSLFHSSVLVNPNCFFVMLRLFNHCWHCFLAHCTSTSSSLRAYTKMPPPPSPTHHHSHSHHAPTTATPTKPPLTLRWNTDHHRH